MRLQLLGAHQRACRQHPVIGAREHPVGLRVRHRAGRPVACAHGHRVAALTVQVDPQREPATAGRHRGCRCRLRERRSRVRAQRLRHRGRNGPGMRRVARLIGTVPAQTGQRVADRRRDARTRGFDGLLAGRGRRVPAQATADHLGHGEQQQPRVGLAQTAGAEGRRPALEAAAQVGPHSGQVRRHQRLGAQLLEQFEHPALQRRIGAQAPVQRFIGVQAPQRESVGNAPEGFCVIVRPGLQVRPVRRQAALTPMQAPATQLQCRIGGERPDRRGAQGLQPLVSPAQRLLARLRRRHVGTGSASKQRW